MSFDVLIGVIQIILVATTPLVFAAIGELVTEKTGVLNLGVEGMMLVGAVTAFVTLVITGSYTLAFIVSLLSGALMSGLFAYLVLISRLWFTAAAPLASSVGVILLTQISLGIMNVVYVLPLYIAIAHNLVAALLLITTLTINYLAWRR